MAFKWRITILLILLVLAYCWKASQLIIKPLRFISPITPANFGLEFEAIKLFTRDGLMLSAWFIPANIGELAPTIITCHGFGTDKADLIDIARFLHIAGYNILMFDFRGHGQSQGKYSSLGYYETLDLESAIDWLLNHGYSKIGAFGVSMGGTTALFVATKNKNLKAVVSEGAYLSFWSGVTSFARCYFKAPKYPFIPPAVWTAGLRLRFNPNQLDLAKVLSQISPTPIFIIHGKEDREINPRDAYTIYEKAREPKKLWLVEGGHHLDAYYIAREEYEKQIIAFFDSALK